MPPATQKEKAKIKKKAEEEAAAEQRDVTRAQMRVLQLKREGAPKLEILTAEAELAKEKREAELSRKTREAAEEGEEERPRYGGGLTVQIGVGVGTLLYAAMGTLPVRARPGAGLRRACARAAGSSARYRGLESLDTRL